MTEVRNRTGQLIQHTWFLPLLIFGVGILVLLGYHPDQQPLRGDRAYLVYMAQGIQRGEPIYQTTSFGYTPFAPMISALTMLGGETVGVENYLAPRYAAIPVFALAGVLLYFISLTLTQNRWLALWAGLINFSFTAMNEANASNLEPKLLVQIFLLLMILSLQHKRWLGAGLCVSLAGMCWQPVAMMAIVPLILAWQAHSTLGWTPLAKVIVGGLLGFLPVVMYLMPTYQLEDFYYQGIYLKFLSSEDVEAVRQTFWLEHILVANLSGWRIMLLPLALLGLLGYFVPNFNGLDATLPRIPFLAEQSGGLFGVTAVWIGYSTLADIATLEVQGPGDFLYAHFMVAFWSAVGLWFCYVQIQRRWAQRQQAVLSALTFVIIILLIVPAYQTEVPYTLAQQQATVAEIEVTSDSQDILVINFQEYYVLTNQPSPWEIILFLPAFETYIEERFSAGCDYFVQDLKTYQYDQIYIWYLGSREFGPCLDTINRTLRRDPLLKTQYQRIKR